MPITLGDFFAAAPYARPVNPRPVKLTAVCRGTVLPGGKPNPTGRPVAATLTGAFVFLGGQEVQSARVEARKALRSRFVDENKIPLDPDPDVYAIEVVYQEVWRALHEWDADTQTVGGRLFPELDTLRELVPPTEANRIHSLYFDYLREEHPSTIDDATFRGAEGAGAGVAAAAPRR